MRLNVAFVITIIALSSCSLQKRLYTKGFYSNGAISFKNQSKKDSTDILTASLKTINTKEKKKKTLLLAKKTNNKNIFYIEPEFSLVDGCDTIFLQGGTIIVAHVSEINKTQVKFKRCETPDAICLFLNKDDVKSITFANGLKEVFETPHQNLPPSPNSQSYNNYQNYQPTQLNTYEKKRKTDKLCITGSAFSFVSIIASIIVGLAQLWVTRDGLFHSPSFFPLSWYLIPAGIAFIGFLLCIIGLYRHYHKKENKKGSVFAIVGAGISFLLMLVIALALLGIIY